MPERGKIIVLVAPSGSGKTTIAKRLLAEFDRLTFSVSATTRPPRTGEREGKDYHFLTDKAFQDRIEQGHFLEWEEFYGGKRYGTLKSAVEDKLNSGYFCLLDIEVEGALNVKQQFGDECKTIFIKPPSLEILRTRLHARGTENEYTLRERLERARHEITYEDRFDHVVINDDLETASQEVQELVHHFINNN